LKAEKSSLPSNSRQYKPPVWPLRQFGGLKVRYKLAILHNLFFFALALAVYLSVVPIFSQHIESAMQREVQMVKQIFGAELPMKDGEAPEELRIYNYRRGTAQELKLSVEGQRFLTEHPSETW
jgi:hypothetical protein